MMARSIEKWEWCMAYTLFCCCFIGMIRYKGVWRFCYLFGTESELLLNSACLRRIFYTEGFFRMAVKSQARSMKSPYYNIKRI